MKDVPQKYRLEWVKSFPPRKEGDRNILKKLTPEQRALLSPDQIEKLKVKVVPEPSTPDNDVTNK